MIDYKSFKPYYKWNTFNTNSYAYRTVCDWYEVLNLIINGIPSILKYSHKLIENCIFVLNLIINGIPSIQLNNRVWRIGGILVLNLIINGIPSIHTGMNDANPVVLVGFKPYYKWNTFNTIK